MLFKPLTLAITLALPLTMVGQNSSPPKQQQQSAEQLSSADKMFLKAIVREDISEINLAKMALQKSSDPQVKQYAQTKILDAAPQMRDRAEQILQNNGISPPSHPNSMQKTMAGRLSGKSGKVFDNAYMNYEASQQTADFELVKTEIESTKNSEMKTYASSEQTPVEQAALAAKDVSTQISSQMQHYRQQSADK